MLPRAEEAATALLQFLKASQQKTASTKESELQDVFALFPTATSVDRKTPVEIDIAFLRAPAPHRVPLFFTLPHEVVSGSICVVTKPPQRRYKDLIAKAQTEQDDPVAHRVKKVIDTKKLAAKFVDPVAVRALANSFDRFIVYQAKRYPTQLTGEFLHHNKVPVWAPAGTSFMDSLHSAMKTAVIPRRGFDMVTVVIGHDGLTAADIAENCRSLIQQLQESPDGAGASILHIRLAACNPSGVRPGLPIYGHNYETTHPGVLLSEPPKQSTPSATAPPAKSAAADPISAPDVKEDEPATKRRRKK